MHTYVGRYNVLIKIITLRKVIIYLKINLLVFLGSVDLRKVNKINGKPYEKLSTEHNKKIECMATLMLKLTGPKKN